MGRPYKCPYCGQSESVSKGVRKTKAMGDRRIRLCKACDRKFTPRNQKTEEGMATPDVSPPAAVTRTPGEKPGEPMQQPIVEPSPAKVASEVPAVPAAPADDKPA